MNWLLALLLQLACKLFLLTFVFELLLLLLLLQLSLLTFVFELLLLLQFSLLSLLDDDGILLAAVNVLFQTLYTTERAKVLWVRSMIVPYSFN